MYDYVSTNPTRRFSSTGIRGRSGTHVNRYRSRYETYRTYRAIADTYYILSPYSSIYMNTHDQGAYARENVLSYTYIIIPYTYTYTFDYVVVFSPSLLLLNITDATPFVTDAGSAKRSFFFFFFLKASPHKTVCARPRPRTQCTRVYIIILLHGHT